MSVRRLAARRDANEKDIIAALLLAGATVRQLSEKGIPDLLAGYQGRTFLIEVKTPTGKLTDDQFEFFETWQGQVDIVRTVEEALEVIRGTGNDGRNANDGRADDGPNADDGT